MGLMGDILAAVDARIRAQAPNMTRMGTVASPYIDPMPAQGYPEATPAMVLLDGDTVAVPVKVFGTTIARGGDRVGCLRVGSDWIIVGSYGVNRPEEAYTQSMSLSAATTTSTFGEALPGVQSVRFHKERNDSHILVTMSLNGIYATAIPTTAYAVAYFKGDQGTGIDAPADVAQIPIAAANNFTNGSGQLRIPWDLATQGAWPTGWYTVSAWWRRSLTSTGTLTAEARSSVSLRVEEVRPSLIAT